MNGYTVGSGGFCGDDPDSLRWVADVPTWKGHVQRIRAAPDGTSRAVVIVMAGGSVVHDVVLPGAAAVDPAATLAAAVRKVAREAGAYPSRFAVDDPGVARRLAEHLRSYEVQVRAKGSMAGVKRAIRRFGKRLDVPVVAWELYPVGSWTAAGVPPDTVARLYAAAASFWRARPWVLVPEPDSLLVSRGEHLSAAVLHTPQGRGHAFTLFTDADDFPDSWGRPGELVLGLAFTGAAGLPMSVRPEAAAADWPVAGPRAHPVLLSNNVVLGKRLPHAVIDYFTDVLAAVAALAAAGLPALDRWTHHAATGVQLKLERPWQGVPWPAVKRARAGCAVGRRAVRSANAAAARRPAAELTAREGARVERYEAHLRALPSGRLVPRRVDAAMAWSQYLAEEAGASAGAATEYDLRMFLYAWFPLWYAGDDSWGRTMPASLVHYFRYLAEHEGIEYPWAAAILRDRRVYLDRLETAPLGEEEPGPDEDAVFEVHEWLAVLHEDLAARAMLPAGVRPGPAALRDGSLREGAPQRELLRRWQVWRDEAIRSGVTDPPQLRARLLRRQKRWESRVNPAVSGERRDEM